MRNNDIIDKECHPIYFANLNFDENKYARKCIDAGIFMDALTAYEIKKTMRDWILLLINVYMRLCVYFAT